jgi:hypothetical protein
MNKKLFAELVDRHRPPPATPYVSILKAVSYIAFGAFLGSDELGRPFKSELPKKNVSPKVVSKEFGKKWFEACTKILASAGRGELVLLGREASDFRAGPTGEHNEIPAKFFVAADEIVIGLSDTLYRKDLKRKMYWEGQVEADLLMAKFPYAEVVEVPPAAELSERGNPKPVRDWMMSPVVV